MKQYIERENDVDTKIVPDLLKKMGYSSFDWTSQYPITAGRTTVKADFFVSSDLSNPNKAINLIIDSKNPDEVLEDYIDQVVSYGRLTKSKFSILLNDTDYLLVDNDSSEILYSNDLNHIPDELYKNHYFVNENIVTYNTTVVKEAENNLKVFEEIKTFNIIFEKCQNEIRNIDGKTGSDAFDELSKLLFIKIYLEDDELRKNNFSIKKINENGVDYLTDTIFKSVKQKYSEIFEQDDKIDLSDESVRAIVKLLEHYNLKATDIDVKGRAYEILLGKTFIGSLGQHFTPRSVVNFMVDMLDPSSKMIEGNIPKIIDPACGSGGFLIKCLEQYLRKAKLLNFDEKNIDKIRKETLYGTDLSPRSVQVSKMNMTLHGDGRGGIFHNDGLKECEKIDCRRYDYLITNPPFGVKVKNKEITKKYNLAPDNLPKEGINAEILFVERCIKLLKNDIGKLGILIPDGLINNKTTKNVREYIIENLDLDAIISLPDRTFKSANANAVTSILFGTKTKDRKNKYTFMALADEIGFERKTKLAKSIAQNDLITIKKYYDDYLKNIEYYNQKDDNIIEICTKPKVFCVKKDFLIKGNRIDAPFYYSKYIFNQYVNGGNCVQLKKYARQVKRSLNKIEDEIDYIEFSSIVPSLGIISKSKKIDDESRPNRAKFLVKCNDIVAARMRDSETNIAIIPKSYENSLVTNGFIVLEPIKPMTVECLYYILYQYYNINQVRWKASGTIMPTVDYSEYLENWVPNYTENDILQITNEIKPYISQLFTSIENLEEHLFQ